MDVLQMVKQWLLTYPGWGATSVYVDYLDAATDAGGLYPQGLEEVKRTEDVLGNVTVSCRYQFALYWATSGQQDNEKNAGLLLDFQQWVQRQNVAGLTPRFGDVASAEYIRAEKGKLQEASQVGTEIYTVRLIAEFLKQYEVKE